MRSAQASSAVASCPLHVAGAGQRAARASNWHSHGWDVSRHTMRPEDRDSQHTETIEATQLGQKVLTTGKDGSVRANSPPTNSILLFYSFCGGATCNAPAPLAAPQVSWAPVLSTGSTGQATGRVYQSSLSARTRKRRTHIPSQRTHRKQRTMGFRSLIVLHNTFSVAQKSPNTTIGHESSPAQADP